MPRRRSSIAPQSDVDVLTRRIDDLERQMTLLRQPGASTIQTDDPQNALDPVQGQVILNHQGTHTPAQSTDPITYYHDGEMKGLREGGANLAMAYLVYDAQIIEDGAWQNIGHVVSPGPAPFVEGYTNPAAEATLPGGSQQQLLVDTLTDGFGPQYGIYLEHGSAAADPNRFGVYTITFACEWDGDDFNGQIGLMLDMSNMLPFTFTANVFDDANQMELLGTSFVRRFQSKTITTIVTGGSGFPVFAKLSAFQNSGGDYDLVLASLLIKQIGWWTQTEGTFTNP